MHFFRGTESSATAHGAWCDNGIITILPALNTRDPVGDFGGFFDTQINFGRSDEYAIDDPPSGCGINPDWVRLPILLTPPTQTNVLPQTTSLYDPNNARRRVSEIERGRAKRSMGSRAGLDDRRGLGSFLLQLYRSPLGRSDPSEELVDADEFFENPDAFP
jgi:hypothetical protein